MIVKSGLDFSLFFLNLCSATFGLMYCDLWTSNPKKNMRKYGVCKAGIFTTSVEHNYLRQFPHENPKLIHCDKMVKFFIHVMIP